jgi:predicted nucleic acid-binding protein
VTYVLDSWAVLRLLEGTEPAASRVAEVMAAGRPTMSWINVGEVFYVIRRLDGESAARTVIRDLRPAVSLELPTETRVLEAARLKADHRLAYADAFAASTAIAHSAVLVTGDPELLLEGAPWRSEDLRAS